MECHQHDRAQNRYTLQDLQTDDKMDCLDIDIYKPVKPYLQKINRS